MSESDDQMMISEPRYDPDFPTTDSNISDLVNSENMSENDSKVVNSETDSDCNSLFNAEILCGLDNNKNNHDNKMMVNDIVKDEMSHSTDSKVPSTTSPVVLYVERGDSVNNENSMNISRNKTPQEERPFVCEICEKRFKRRSHYNIHIATHKTEKTFVCKVCSKAFSHHYFLQRHEVIHNTVKQFSCEYCNEEFSVRRYYTRHIRRHMRKSYECDACDFITHKLKESNNHVKSHGGRVFTCDKCNRSFCQELSLNLHQCFEFDEKRFTCKYCSKKFKKVYDMYDHVAIHEDKKSVVCDICEKRFNTKMSLWAHKSTKHKEENEDKPYSCEKCGKKFHAKSNLTRHEKRHAKYPQFSARDYLQSDSVEDARKTCVNKIQKGIPVGYINVEAPEPLQLPVYFIPGKKINYVCDICLKGFADKHNLRAHYRRHTGEKPFECNVCNWRFVDNTDLRRHLSTHTKDRKYTCEYCNKNFTRKSNMTVHLKTVCPARKQLPQIAAVCSVPQEESL